jgi:hypothetical protein
VFQMRFRRFVPAGLRIDLVRSVEEPEEKLGADPTQLRSGQRGVPGIQPTKLVTSRRSMMMPKIAQIAREEDDHAEMAGSALQCHSGGATSPAAHATGPVTAEASLRPLPASPMRSHRAYPTAPACHAVLFCRSKAFNTRAWRGGRVVDGAPLLRA